MAQKLMRKMTSLRMETTKMRVYLSLLRRLSRNLPPTRLCDETKESSQRGRLGWATGFIAEGVYYSKHHIRL